MGDDELSLTGQVTVKPIASERKCDIIIVYGVEPMNLTIEVSDLSDSIEEKLEVSCSRYLFSRLKKEHNFDLFISVSIQRDEFELEVLS